MAAFNRVKWDGQNNEGEEMTVKRFFILLLILLCTGAALAEEEADWSIWDVIDMDDQQAIEAETSAGPDEEETPAEEETMTAREDFINRIVALGEQLYIQADGRSQRAHYKGDIYVCKNFTVHLFRENRDDFCMAEYPDVQLKIPNNLPSDDCKPYYYGIAWQEVAAKDGNPFYEAASFRYNSKLSKEENLELAKEFMRQAQRGDYFQMSAKYEYGTGAHSAIMLGYDAETDEIHWMDSNMRGGKKNGIRYGLVQFDEVKSVEWWASTFCLKGRGATLYRLRDDIAYRED